MKLKEEDAKVLIKESSSDKTVLVGGQAVAFWASFYSIESRLPALTSDIDYMATAAEAKKANAKITFKHSLKVATMDDATVNAAVTCSEPKRNASSRKKSGGLRFACLPTPSRQTTFAPITRA